MAEHLHSSRCPQPTWLGSNLESWFQVDQSKGLVICLAHHSESDSTDNPLLMQKGTANDHNALCQAKKS